MSVYVAPATNAVDFAIKVFTPANLTPAGQALTATTPAARTAVDFAITVYTQPTYPNVGWELLPGAGSVTGSLAWTEANDVSALAAAVSQSAALTWTETNDLTAIVIEASISETIAWTSENDVTAITATAGGTSADADLAWVEDDDATDIQAFVDPAILIFDGHDGKPFKEKKPKWQHDKERNDKRRATIAESIYGKPVVVVKQIAPLAEIETTDDDEESILMLML